MLSVHIDWSSRPTKSSVFAGVPESQRPGLLSLCQSQGLTFAHENPCYVLAPGNGGLTTAKTLKDDRGQMTVVRPLTMEDAVEVNAAWKFRDGNSLGMIRGQIRRGLGFGVYAVAKETEEEEELVSWVICMK